MSSRGARRQCRDGVRATQVQGQFRARARADHQGGEILGSVRFTIPETALQIALQEDKFHAYQRDLSLKLSQYDSLISRIAPVESDLLTRQVAILQQRTLRIRLYAVELELATQCPRSSRLYKKH